MRYYYQITIENERLGVQVCDMPVLSSRHEWGGVWYRVKDHNGKWDYGHESDARTRPQLKDINPKAEYLGRTHNDGTTYYSLFGSKLKADSLNGKIAALIDDAIIRKVLATIVALEKNTHATFPKTNFNITGYEAKERSFVEGGANANAYEIEYEGSYWGKYRTLLGSSDKMIGSMEEWIGDSDMPKDKGGWKAGPKDYIIEFVNAKGGTIIDLRYKEEQAKVLLERYYKIFPELKKQK